MKRLMELCMPLESGMMTTARLTTGGLCSLVGLDLDKSEDCKVCLTESLLLLTHRGYPHARVHFFEENGLVCRVTGEGEPKEGKEFPEDEISFALLGAMGDSVSTEKKDGRLSEIVFLFRK